VSTGLFSGNTQTQKHTFPANKFLESTQPRPQAQNRKMQKHSFALLHSTHKSPLQAACQNNTPLAAWRPPLIIYHPQVPPHPNTRQAALIIPSSHPYDNKLIMVFLGGLRCLCNEMPTSSTILTSQQKRRNEISILIAKIAASYQGELTEQVPRSICCHC
jgi:hypothetical protein